MMSIEKEEEKTHGDEWMDGRKEEGRRYMKI